MGGVAILDLGKGLDRNPAPVADYGALYHGLQGASSRFIAINGAGEAVGYSDQMKIQYSPETVAGHVKRGGVWVDYCGFPMYYQAKADGTVSTLGQSGWHQFAEFLGYGWLRNAQFTYPGEFTLHTQYPFRRGFPLNQSLDGVCYAHQNFRQSSGFLGLGVGGTFPTAADGFASMVALHRPNEGYYFYGSYHYDASGVLASALNGIPTSLYVTFIRNVLSGNVGSYTCSRYKIGVQKTSHITPGPTSPVSNGSGRSSRSTSRSTPSKSSQASSHATTVMVEEILGGVLIVGGLGLGAAAVVHHRERGR